MLDQAALPAEAAPPWEAALGAIKAEFDRNGYAVIRNALPAGTVADLNRLIDQILEDEGQPNAITVFNAAMKHDLVLRLVEHEAILPIVVNLLGFNLQLHASTINVKRPFQEVRDEERFTGGKLPGGNTAASLNWHRDGPAPQFPWVQDFSLKVGYILSDLSAPDRGNTKVIPGSHRRRDYRPEQGDSNVEVPGETQICGSPGDAFVFTQNLWHGASFNRSPIERRMIFIGYGACWTRPLDYETVPPELLENASPDLRQLLGQVGPLIFHHYMPEFTPLETYWRGEAPVRSYAP